eukprot:879347-Amphidinium_carterae.1
MRCDPSLCSVALLGTMWKACEILRRGLAPSITTIYPCDEQFLVSVFPTCQLSKSTRDQTLSLWGGCDAGALPPVLQTVWIQLSSALHHISSVQNQTTNHRRNWFCSALSTTVISACRIPAFVASGVDVQLVQLASLQIVAVHGC